MNSRVPAVLALVAMLLVQAPPAAAQQSAKMCRDGVVERIEIENGSVFPTDTTNPRLVSLAFGIANRLHVNTRPAFIRRELLFAAGDCYEAFLVSESRRLLDAYRFVDQVRMDTSSGAGGGKIVRISTRDRWSAQFDASVTYDAGLHVERLKLVETNFLGRGILAEVNHSRRRETEDRTVAVSSPRFFGRTDAEFRIGSTGAGSTAYQRLGWQFLGEASRWSWTESVSRSTTFQQFATGGAAPFSNVLVPITRDGAELAMARRFGTPGRSWILGAAIDRTVYRQAGGYEFVQNGNFGGAGPDTFTVTPEVMRQTGNRGATRLALHGGLRRMTYADHVGLDALSEVRIVPSGIEASLSAGRSLGVAVPSDIPDAGDTFVRTSFGVANGGDWGVLRVNGYGEAGRVRAGWRDVFGAVDASAWLRASWLPAQTFFLRAAAGGAWRTTVPFQLALGGRDGIRSLRDDDYPGGRRVMFVAENRIRFPWPRWSGAELGATVFADAGRVMPGDVPYGSDAGWMGSAGFGLRIALPKGSSELIKPEIAFPLGRPGRPVFRVTTELNSVRGQLFTQRVMESRRFWRGAEHY